MIFDNIKNYTLYTSLKADFKEALELISSNGFEKAAGRHDFKNGMYYLVQNYETKPESECFFESHRKYIDIQYIVSGKERHDVANISGLTVREDYNAEKDILKYNGAGSILLLGEGDFAVYFPEDGHKPNIMTGSEPVNMTKVIFKIPV